MSGIYENPMDRQDDPRDADDFLRGEAAQGEQAVELIVRDVCELDPADADAPDTVSVSVEDLTRIVERHTRPQPVAVAGDVESRAREFLAAQYERSGAPSAARAVREGALSPIERGDILPAIIAALSAAPAAPEAGKIVVSEAALRLAIREVNHARKGVDSAGRANYVHRLLLAMLGQEPIHDVEEPAAPAPVADGAVSEMVRTAPERIYLQVADEDYSHESFPHDSEDQVTWCASSCVECEVEYVRADLAQDRASQGAKRVPTGPRFTNTGDSEAQFIADGERLDCPACGGSGHAEDASQAGAAGGDNSLTWLGTVQSTPAAEGEVRNG